MRFRIRHIRPARKFLRLKNCSPAKTKLTSSKLRTFNSFQRSFSFAGRDTSDKITYRTLALPAIRVLVKLLSAKCRNGLCAMAGRCPSLRLERDADLEWPCIALPKREATVRAA
jgi:hypothetical protein